MWQTLGFGENKSSSGHLPHISSDLHGEPPNQTLSNIRHEHYGQWSIQGQKYSKTTLMLLHWNCHFCFLQKILRLIWHCWANVLTCYGSGPFLSPLLPLRIIVDLTTEGPRTRQMLKVRRLRRREENGRTNYLLSCIYATSAYQWFCYKIVSLQCFDRFVLKLTYSLIFELCTLLLIQTLWNIERAKIIFHLNSL